MVADFKPDSQLSQLQLGKKKIGFSIGTYGELARRDRQRREARSIRNVSSRPRVPTQEKPPRTPRVFRNENFESMKMKIEHAIDHIDDVEPRREATRRYYKKEYNTHAKSTRQSGFENLHHAVAPYVGDYWHTRRRRCDVYVPYDTGERTQKQNPWDFETGYDEETATPVKSLV